MDERIIAATLAAALVEKTDIAADRDAVQVATKIYVRMLRGIRKTAPVEDAPDPAKPDATPATATPATQTSAAMTPSSGRPSPKKKKGVVAVDQ